MLISIFFLLLIFGGGGAMLALIVFAIMNRRLWLIPAAGGLVFFGLVACGLLASLFFGFAQHSVTVKIPAPNPVVGQINATTRTVAQAPPNFNTYSGSDIAMNYSGVMWSKVLLVTLLIVSLVAIVFRRLISPCASHGFRRTWPAIAVGLFIGAMLLFRVRSDYSEAHQASYAAAAAAQQAALEMAARQQLLIANQSAHIQSQVSQQLAQADIHEQMDKFDAPRIPLPPQPLPPASVAVPPDAAASTATRFAAAKESVERSLVLLAQLMQDSAQLAANNAAAGLSDTATADSEEKPTASDDKPQSPPKHKRTVKPVASVDGKNKKADKATDAGELKAITTIAQSKPPEKATAKKENASASDNSSSTAESKPENANSRPAWVNEKPKKIGNVRREVIETEEFALADECYQAADVYLLLKTYQYVQQLADRPYPEFELPSITFRNGQIFADGNMISTGGPNSKWIDGRIRSLTDMGIGIDFARSQLVTKDSKGDAREYVETLEHPAMGPMKKLYLQIEFTPAVEGVIRQCLAAAQRQQRFAMAGAGAGSILSLLALAFALLKIDTWTKGYYTKRLFIGVPAAIIAGFILLTVLGLHPTIR
jgi:hypothetical protein